MLSDGDIYSLHIFCFILLSFHIYFAFLGWFRGTDSASSKDTEQLILFMPEKWVRSSITSWSERRHELLNHFIPLYVPFILDVKSFILFYFISQNILYLLGSFHCINKCQNIDSLLNWIVKDFISFLNREWCLFFLIVKTLRILLKWHQRQNILYHKYHKY